MRFPPLPPGSVERPWRSRTLVYSVQSTRGVTQGGATITFKVKGCFPQLFVANVILLNHPNPTSDSQQRSKICLEYLGMSTTGVAGGTHDEDNESITSTQRNDQHQATEYSDGEEGSSDEDDEDDDDETVSTNSSNNDLTNNILLQQHQDNIDSEMRHGFGEAYSSEEYLQVSSIWLDPLHSCPPSSQRKILTAITGTREELLSLLDRSSTCASFNGTTRAYHRMESERSNKNSCSNLSRLFKNWIRSS